MMRKCRVHALPTEKAKLNKGQLVVPFGGSIFGTYVESYENSIFIKFGSGKIEEYEDDPKPHHLYITTTDEEIKEGDFVVNTKTNSLAFVDCKANAELANKEKGLRFRIVASTNSELWYKEVTRQFGPRANIHTEQIPLVAKIADDFVQAFVRENGNIQELNLEYEPDRPEGSTHYAMGSFNWQLKLRSNGTCIIHPIKQQTFTAEEVMNLITGYCVNSTQDAEATECDFPNLFNDMKRNVTNWFNTYYKNK